MWRYEWLLANTLAKDRDKIPEPILAQHPWEEPEPEREPERPRMSSREEMRAFFKGGDGSTKVVVSAG